MLERVLKKPAVTVLALALVSVSVSQQAAAQADKLVPHMLAKLNALTNGHVYRLLSSNRETIRYVAFERSQGLLGLGLDDVAESFPTTAIIPLREIEVRLADFKSDGRVEDGILLSCRESDCITITREYFDPAVQKLSKGPGAKLVGATRRGIFQFGCKGDACFGIRNAIRALSKIPKGE